jgi:diguanylate cyclase (GGDEF)-like protein
LVFVIFHSILGANSFALSMAICPMPSTFFVLFSGAVLCFILLLVSLSLQRTSIPGVQDWCAANALAIVAFTLYAFGRQLPPFLAYEAANGASVAAVAAVLVGYRRFFGRRVSLILIGASVGAAVAAIAIFHYVINSFGLRTATVSLFYVIACLAIVRTVFRARAAWTSRYVYMFSGVMAFIVAVGYGVRGLLQMSLHSAPTSLLEPSPWNLVVLSASTLVMPVLTLGPLMMVHSKMIAQYEYAANRDFLTGAWSRRAFWKTAVREMARARRTGRDLSLLAMDVDHFKRINDTYGHAEGDRVLKELVLRAEETIRSIDYFGRIGGEEFALLMPDTGIEGALAVGERLRAELALDRSLTEAHNSSLPITRYTVSIGVAALRDRDTFQDLLQRADAALYRAKAEGRNRVICEAAPLDGSRLH